MLDTPMLNLILAFVCAFAITYFAIPAIIAVARKKQLFDQPNERSSHVFPTPSLGGIAIFSGAICGIILFTPVDLFDQLQFTIAAFMLLFLVGIRDDLMPIPAKKKLLAQLIAAAILTFKAGVLVQDWDGLLGIHQTAPVFSYLFSIVAMVVIINAFNLIDGINGLAGGMGLLVSLTFGTWFYLAGQVEWAVVSLALAGALLGFLRFNVTTPSRIFMGDTGSLFVGTACAILGFEFIGTNQQLLSTDNPWYCASAPAFVLGVLAFPLYDTVRIFFNRMMRGRSPFEADRNHIHHILVSCGFSHLRSSLLLISTNAILIALCWYFRNININGLLCLVVGSAFGLNILLTRYFLRQAGEKPVSRPKRGTIL
jgi:UDP-GlcNAc:undecaprenyl-phosphate/decaprenyl-phosphate GlcNAc-1-phosphate transferase